ncbi:MAG: hypothetical protein EXR49_01910 [Dehalococcoidia bacterium]|nr:hypothetical protein [Dehalococcoidia bacterium]
MWSLSPMSPVFLSGKKEGPWEDDGGEENKDTLLDARDLRDAMRNGVAAGIFLPGLSVTLGLGAFFWRRRQTTGSYVVGTVLGGIVPMVTILVAVF